jgi:magnesium transporter
LTYNPLLLAGTVGLAMCNAMGFASSFGGLIPVLLHRLRVDPALASGPFVTTSNDLSATLIYFLTCTIALGLG